MKFEGRMHDDANVMYRFDKKDAALLISKRGVPSAPQKEALSDLLVQLQDLGLWNEALHDLHDLTRFMRARNWDVAAALHMWTQMVKWRQQHGADNILTHFDFVERPAFLKVYTTGLHKTDLQGRPILIQQLGRVNLTAIGTITTDERMCLWHIQEYERLFRVIFPACSRHQGLHIDQLFTIIDLEGVSFTDMIRVRKLLTMFMKMDSDNYPETLAVMAIINAPYWFGRMWAAIKEFLQGDTVKKIQILSSDYQPFLLEHIAPENLLTCYGGTSHGSITHNLGPWNNPSPNPLLPPRQHQSREPSALHPHPHQPSPGPADTTSERSAKQLTVEDGEQEEHPAPSSASKHRHSSHSPQHARPSHLPHVTPSHHPLPIHTSKSTREPSSMLDFDRRYIQPSPVKAADPLMFSPRRSQDHHPDTENVHISASSPRSRKRLSPPNSPPSPPLSCKQSSPNLHLPNTISPCDNPHSPHPDSPSPHNPDTGLFSPSDSGSSSASYEDPQGQSPILRVSVTSGQSDDPFFSPCSTMSRGMSGMGSPSSTHRSLFCTSPYSHSHAATAASNQHAWQQAGHIRTQNSSTAPAVSALTASLSLPAPVPRKSSTMFPTGRPTSPAQRHRVSYGSSSTHPLHPKMASAFSSPSPLCEQEDGNGTTRGPGTNVADSTLPQHSVAGRVSPQALRTARTSFAAGEGVHSSRYAASIVGSVAGSVGFWSAASSPSRRSSVDSVTRGSASAAAATAVHQQRGFHMAVVAAGHALANGSSSARPRDPASGDIESSVNLAPTSVACRVEIPGRHPPTVSSHTASVHADMAVSVSPRLPLSSLLLGVSKHRRGPASMDANDAIAAAEAACAAADALQIASHHRIPPFAPQPTAAGEIPGLIHGSRHSSMGQRMLSLGNLLAPTAEHTAESDVVGLTHSYGFHDANISHQLEHTHTLHSTTPVANAGRTMPISSRGHSRTDSITQRQSQGFRQGHDSQQEFVDDDTDADDEDDEAHLLTSASPPLATVSSSAKPWYLSLPGATWFRHRVQSSRHRRVHKHAVFDKHDPVRECSSFSVAALVDGSSSGGDRNGEGSGGETGKRRSYTSILANSGEEMTRSLLPPSGPSVSGMVHLAYEGHSVVRAGETAVAMVGLSGLHGSGGSGKIGVEAVAELVTGLVVGAGEAFKTHARAAGRRVRQNRARKRRQQEKQRGVGSWISSLLTLCCCGQG